MRLHSSIVSYLYCTRDIISMSGRMMMSGSSCGSKGVGGMVGKKRSAEQALAMHHTVTLTFGDCAENHVGMQRLGQASEHGYSKSDLEKIREKCEGCEVEYIALHEVCEPVNAASNLTGLPEAYVLIVRNAISNKDALLNEMVELDWDRKAMMRGKVVNKHARFNLCFDDFDQEPDYAAGKGRVIDIARLPMLQSLYSSISEFPESEGLKVEGNYYYDLNECGIGFHGDSERSKVIGVRLGQTCPLYYQWYQKSNAISKPYRIDLNHGDLYVMSEKAVGRDWKKKVVPTLRHAAGASKYTKVK